MDVPKGEEAECRVGPQHHQFPWQMLMTLRTPKMRLRPEARRGVEGSQQEPSHDHLEIDGKRFRHCITRSEECSAFGAGPSLASRAG